MSTIALDAALSYARRGWVVVPIPHGEKNPGRKGWQTAELTEAGLHEAYTIERNIGIRLGEASGGLVDIDLDWREAAAIAPALLPPTGAVFGRASKRASHRLYRASLTKSRKYSDPTGKGGDSTIIELRCQANQQTVFPPSLHGRSGELVEWECDEAPEEVDPTELADAVARVAACALIARHWPVKGTRNDTALALSGALLRSLPSGVARQCMAAIIHLAPNDDPAGKLATFDATARKLAAGEAVTGWPALAEHVGDRVVDAVRDWLGLREDVVSLVRPTVPVNGVNGHAPPVRVPSEIQRTDLGNGRLMITLFGEELRYVTDWKRWLVYDGTRWAKDGNAIVAARAMDTVKSLWHDATHATELADKKASVQHALKSESAKGLREMMWTAAQLVSITPGELDRDRYLLNVQNGTLDLRTAELLPHDPAHLITKIVAIPFDPRAACPRFERFMLEIMDGCAESVRTLQQWVGYCLSGDVSEEKLLFYFGVGSNGKSLLIRIQLLIAGDYGIAAPKGLLELKKNDSHPAEVAKLFGARLAVANETAQGRRWNEQMVKDLTSRDKQSARGMREDWWDFDPTHKIVVAGNHKPPIRGTDNGIWRRLKLVPFSVTFDGASEESKALPSLLESEAPGILAWAVRGFLDWQKNGLVLSERITRATGEYRTEMDTLARFIEERCVVEPAARAKGGDLYKAYKAWCDDVGERMISQTEFGLSLGERGFEVRKSDGNKIRIGIGLAPTLGLG